MSKSKEKKKTTQSHWSVLLCYFPVHGKPVSYIVPSKNLIFPVLNLFSTVLLYWPCDFETSYLCVKYVERDMKADGQSLTIFVDWPKWALYKWQPYFCCSLFTCTPAVPKTCHSSSFQSLPYIKLSEEHFLTWHFCGQVIVHVISHVLVELHWWKKNVLVLKTYLCFLQQRIEFSGYFLLWLGCDHVHPHFDVLFPTLIHALALVLVLFLICVNVSVFVLIFARSSNCSYLCPCSSTCAYLCSSSNTCSYLCFCSCLCPCSSTCS